MRSHTLLFVCALVVCARAASIPAPAAPALELKLVEAAEQALQDAKPLDNIHSEQELIDEVNEVKDIDNNLRKVPHNVDAIPVKIVTETVQPSLKNEGVKIQLDDVELDAEPEIKRVKADISNTGEPQRQEHDSQSPGEQNEEQQSVATIKQTISETQNVISQGFQGVTNGFENWFSNNDQLTSIQQSIQNLQLNFQNQITKLNATIQGYWKPETDSSSSTSSTGTESETATGTKGLMENVEKGLEVIENNFEYGVKSMVSGVQVLAQVKAENETGTVTNNPLQGFTQYLTQFQTSITEGFNNLQSSIQQYVTQNQQNNNNNTSSTGPIGFFQNLGAGIQNIISQPGSAATSATPTGAQSDEAAGTTVRPTIWQGIQSSIQNIWNRPGSGSGQAGSQGQQGSQTTQNAVGTGPIAQAIQSNPLYQNVVNLIQRPTEKPEAEATQGANAVPASNEKPEESKPESDEQQKEKPEVAPAAGPLQQIVQRNPIMQGLAGAVHKIQTSIVNPEKPRDDKDTKAGWYGGYPGGHNHTPAQGDNNNSNGVEGVKSETPKKEDIAPIAVPPKQPDTLQDKTES